MIDTHAHLYFKDYNSDFSAVMERSRSEGVNGLICVGINEKTSRQSLKIAEDNPDVWATVGIHPHDAAGVSKGYLSILKELACSPRVVAIGEAGLDYYRNYSPRDVQKKIFCEQIALARNLKKPLVIHCRDAYDELMEIILAEKLYEAGAVVHCYSGDYKFAQKALEMGFYISIAGPVTYPRSDLLRSVVKMIPLNRLLLETDAPFLTPQPWRGKRNEPSYIKATYKTVAEIKQVTLLQLIHACQENTTSLFGL